jgi:hypothetical protein
VTGHMAPQGSLGGMRNDPGKDPGRGRLPRPGCQSPQIGQLPLPTQPPDRSVPAAGAQLRPRAHDGDLAPVPNSTVPVPLGGVRMGWSVLLACWAVAAAIALALGRDANWDLRNYHFYNPYALLEGRWGLDLAPAGLHSFLHPGLDLPFYLLTRSPLNAWPRVVSTLQAGYLGILIFLTLAVANLACHGTARWATAESMLTAAFGLTGAATLPQAGATFNDVPVACLVLGALLTLLKAADCGAITRHAALQKRRSARLWLLSGVLGGTAVGLKLTATVYAPALFGAAILASHKTCVSPTRAVAMLVAGGALGFIVSFGPWGWFLYEQFSNPFGPYFNDFFHSPWFPPDRQSDPRFLPDGIAQALVYPLLWVRPSIGAVTEETVADPRFALGIAGTLLTLGSVGLRRLLHNRDPVGFDSTAEQAAVRVTRVVLAFILIAYVAWLGAFAILRYAVAIEVLLGIAIWATARTLLTFPGTGTVLAARRRCGAAVCVGALLLLCALATTYPQWPRQPFHWEQDPRGPASVAVTPAVLPEGSLVVMLWGAVSFVAPFVQGPGVRFVGAAHPVWAGSRKYLYAAQVQHLVRSHHGPGFVLLEEPENYDQELAQSLGVEFDLTSCRAVSNNLTTLVQICRWQ